MVDLEDSEVNKLEWEYFFDMEQVLQNRFSKIVKFEICDKATSSPSRHLPAQS